MNSGKCVFFPALMKASTLFLIALVALGLCVYLCGCADNVRLPSAGELAEFERAGFEAPVVDTTKLTKAKIGGGPYRVGPGDVLEFTMPSILQAVSAYEVKDLKTREVAPYVCRISDTGTITLPIIGEMKVAGKTLAEIEADVVDAYHPEYSATRPSLFASVLEPKMAAVSVTGAVTNPGVYELARNKMSLVAALMEAGGIIDDGAAVIRITHADGTPFEETPETTQEQENESQDETRAAMEPELPLEANGVEVEIAFGQFNRSGTVGQLVLEFDGEKLVFEQVDIGSDVQVQTLLAELAERDSRIPTALLEQRLHLLADLLEPELIPGQMENQKPKEVMTQENDQAEETETPRQIILPVRGFNIPFADVALQDGDSIEVERLELPLFTVLGLVNKPGNFPYPPSARYNLMQAMGFAGGLEQSAEPRYATVYRLKSNGTIVGAIFPVVPIPKGPTIADASNTLVKPGDIIIVEHTPRTRTNQFLDRAFRISLGMYVPLYLDVLGSER